MIIILIISGIFVLFQLINNDIPIKLLLKGNFKGIQSIYRKHDFDFKFKYLIWIILLLSISIIVIGLMFFLPYDYILALLLLCWLSYPMLLLWQAQFRYHAYEFEQITGFLQHFMAHFKSHSKVLLALIETKPYTSGQLLGIIEKSIEKLEKEGNANEAFSLITARYPHFIVWNVQTWITSAELFGVDDCKEAIELLEDDIDDWIEDMHLHVSSMHHMRNRILMLCAIACVIALFNQRMLIGFMDLSSQGIYHDVIFVFLMMVLFTILMSYRFMKRSWINKGECLWKESS